MVFSWSDHTQLFLRWSNYGITGLVAVHAYDFEVMMGMSLLAQINK